MLIIGLCGGSGSGKGTVAQRFERYNIPSIDADLVYRELLENKGELLFELREAFGESILDERGMLDRKRLSEIVFSAEHKDECLPMLNRITHSAVIAETERRIEILKDTGVPAVIFDAPLLFESGFDKRCDTIIAVLADTETRLNRIMARDSITREFALARISVQLPDSFLEERADHIIVNNGSLAELDAQVSAIAEKIFERG